MESFIKQDKSILAVGIILWATGLLMSALFEGLPQSIEGQLFINISTTRPWLLSTLVFCLAIPIFAEGIFRGWTANDNFMRYISVGCMALALIPIWVLATTMISIATAAIATGAVVFLIIVLFAKNMQTSTRTVSFIVGSSIVWIAYYVSRCDIISWLTLFDVTKLIGAALIFCYFAINYRLMTAVFLHTTNNLIVAIPLLIILSCNDRIYINADSKDAEINRIYNNYNSLKFEGTTSTISGDMEGIVSYLASLKQGGNTIYRFEGKTLPLKYNILVDNYRNPANIDLILRQLICSKMLRADTTYEPMYVMSVCDDGINNTKINNCCSATIYDIIRVFRTNYGLALVPKHSLNTSVPLVPLTPEELASNGNTCEDLIQYTRYKYGLIIEAAPYDKACVVHLRDARLLHK